MGNVWSVVASGWDSVIPEQKCEYCDKKIKGWTSSFEMKEHVRLVHKRMIKCNVCHEEIYKMDEKEHMKKHKMSSRLLSNTDTIYRCGICYKIFTTNKKYRSHRELAHGSQAKPIQCRTCLKRFITHEQYVKHWNNRHNDEYYRHALIGKVKTESNFDINTKSECSFLTIGKKIFHQAFADVSNSMWDVSDCYCSCINCWKSPAGGYVFNMRNTKISIPKNCVYFGFNITEGAIGAFVDNKNVFNWDACYHGTSVESIKKVMATKLTLLKPNDMTYDGERILIGEGHIPRAFDRLNAYNNKKELFDPTHSVFVTPSILYAAKYSQDEKFIINSKEYIVQFIIGCLIEPKSYQIGPSTLPQEYHFFDPYISNSEIEWYTTNSWKIQPHGIFIKIL
eukprot:324547_1